MWKFGIKKLSGGIYRLMLSFPSDCLDIATVCAATKVDIDVIFPFRNTS